MVCYVNNITTSPSPRKFCEVVPDKSSSCDNQVIIRPYESCDREECRELFAEGMWQLANPAMKMTLPGFLRYAGCLAVLVVGIAMKYSFVILPLYVVLVALFSACLYIHIYMECYKFINSCLNMDLKDIRKSYMDQKGSHMWVAELKGQVVGMVGVIHTEDHHPSVVELQRMTVSRTTRRLGIAKKLLQKSLTFSKEYGYKKIILSTTGAQTPAISLYKQAGFSIFSSIPHPASSLLRDLPYNSYELKL